MPDRIDDLVNQASAARLGRLFAMLNAAPTEVDDIWPRLRDPAVVAACLAAFGAADLVALVLDPTSPLVRIQTTFERAREFVARATDDEARAAAELLYQASAAAALVRHGVVLGTRPMAAREILYASLAPRLAGGPFSQLFAAAAEAAVK